jgi:tetratricopeptide (TPR) repeat protein
MTTLSSSGIRRWSEAGLFRHVNLGLSTDDANRQAERCWIEILAGKDVSIVLSKVAEVPDTLHALAQFLLDSTEAASSELLGATAAVYEFASAAQQSFAAKDERDVLSATFAYLAWRCCRRMALWHEARSWESRCERHVIGQDDAVEYLRLPASERGRISSKFLGDRPTLLVACRQLRKQANTDPTKSLQFSVAAYRWIVSGWEDADLEERSFFAGELALATASALRLARRFVESEPWFRASAEWFARTANPAPLLATVELSVAAALHNRLDLDESLARLPQLLWSFSAFGMEEELRKCQVLEGMVLKDMGRMTEAIDRLTNVIRAGPLAESPLVYGLALAHLGEAQASVGALKEASKSFAQAIPLIEEANVPWVIADCKAMLAEALRDQGSLEEAIPLYRSAVQMNMTMELDARAAYLRILLAETLMMSGRQEEAAHEIVEALPVLERESLVPAANAAIALLQESLRRQRTDPERLRRLGVELQKMSEQNRS